MTDLSFRTSSPKKGIASAYRDVVGRISQEWDPAQRPLLQEHGSRKVFTEAIAMMASETNSNLPIPQQSEAIIAGAAVTACFAHTMAEFSRFQQHSKEEYLERLTHPDSMGVLTWVAGIRRNLATTIEDMIGLRDNDNYGGVTEKIGYYVVTDGGFGLKSEPTIIATALRNNPFFNPEDGLYSKECFAARSGMIKSGLIATVTLIENDPRLLDSMLL